jgi:hypothetical protein
MRLRAAAISCSTTVGTAIGGRPVAGEAGDGPAGVAGRPKHLETFPDGQQFMRAAHVSR